MTVVLLFLSLNENELFVSVLYKYPLPGSNTVNDPNQPNPW